MVQTEAKCNDCCEVYIIEKAKITEDFVLGNCPKCGSSNTKRVWGIGATDVAVGMFGNSKTSFSKGPVSHPSIFGKFKGTRIK